MRAEFKKCVLGGSVYAPPSKSMAHRLLIGAAMTQGESVISGLEYSEDVLATLDCLRALGAKAERDKDSAVIDGNGFLNAENPVLYAHESGSTLRFLIPFAWLSRGTAMFLASERLLRRPLDIYEKIAEENGFLFEKGKNTLKTRGELKSGVYEIDGGVSSQFISGLIFALLRLSESSEIRIKEPFESRPYVLMTVEALSYFGAKVSLEGNTVKINAPQNLAPYSGKVEGDWSNAAFLEVYNALGGTVNVSGLDINSTQGDKVYRGFFALLENGAPTLDISDCPDLAPVLIALAAAKNGAVFVGTRRLAAKESDRGKAMRDELLKFGVSIKLEENKITVPNAKLSKPSGVLDGHNDHRIVMALSALLTLTGGAIDGAEAVKKSFPSYFEVIGRLGAEVILK